MKGFVATLLSKWDKLNDDQKKMMLETVNVDADRLTRLIAELLDVARIDTGRLSLYPRPVDIRVAVDRVVALMSAGTGREIAFEVEGDLPTITADPDKFVQVVTNLVDNALRHGEGRVGVTASAIAAPPYDGVLLTRRRRGRRHQPGHPQPGVHEVLEARHARRLRARACTSSTAWSPPTAARWRSTTHPPVVPGSASAGRTRTAAPSECVLTRSQSHAPGS